CARRTGANLPSRATPCASLTIEGSVSEVGEWQLDAAVAAELERLGWRAGEPGVRDVVPLLVRGGNAIVVVPPAPAWAATAVAPLLAVPAAERETILIVTAPALLDEWLIAIGALCRAGGRQVVALRHADHQRELPRDMATVVIATPVAAIALHQRSGLHPERLRGVCFAWPEDWPADVDVAAILGDCPEDAQRVVLTARPDQVQAPEGIASRYARRAITIAWPGAEPGRTATAPLRTVHTVPVPWSDRAVVVARVLDAAELGRATIWTADTRDHPLIDRATVASGAVRVACRGPAEAGPTVCYDPPSPSDYHVLLDAGDVVLLVPPGTERYLARLAPEAKPLDIAGTVDAVLDRDAKARGAVARAVEQHDHAGALYALAPLFNEYQPQLIAAALFDLWRSMEAAPPEAPAVSGTIRVRVAAGKRDGATPGDFVAVLVKEVGLDRSRIGRIELHDTYSLVEVPAADADTVARRLTGLTIRRRRLAARVDRR
ncbi:MAG: DbpA RNA binding domain-containing protein, partial [Gemmatimonadales bacterium]